MKSWPCIKSVNCYSEFTFINCINLTIMYVLKTGHCTRAINQSTLRVTWSKFLTGIKITLPACISFYFI